MSAEPVIKKIKELLLSGEVGKDHFVRGWVRTRRDSKNISFIALNDGTAINNLQVIADSEKFGIPLLQLLTTGACIAVSGKLVASQGSGQKVELVADRIDVLGPADPEKYPLQPKKHSLEFLREIAHLRPRTNTFGAVFRVRHALAFAVHKFFNERDFICLHTPIISSSDCEGAGEMFRVTTLDLKNIPKDESGGVDFSQDFFGIETGLTVSGQLEGELGAMGLNAIYTFGPTFRAENSNTSRHLAEFWMIEPEVAFYDLADNMNLAEELLKYIIRYAMEQCGEDLAFLSRRAVDEDMQKKKEDRQPMELLEKLQSVTGNIFERITYTDAIDILKHSKPNKEGKFKFPVQEWGMDMQSEHERFLVEKKFSKPVIITDYPKKIKAFYMRQNDDGKTVRAMDILFPGIGEVVGGSQREERYDLLKHRIEELGINIKTLWWYLDTRRFGSAPHSGFGLGFERLVQFVTGMGNIRDVIPFPRTPKNAEF